MAVQSGRSRQRDPFGFVMTVVPVVIMPDVIVRAVAGEADVSGGPHFGAGGVPFTLSLEVGPVLFHQLF